jgi:glyoxylase-like metal-dependent hydrolase (beta-lactamase superfamily II)
MEVGELRIEAVLDGVAVMPPAAAFSAMPGASGKGGDDADWAPHRAMLNGDGMLEMAMGGFLVRGGPLGERVVLVDCGVGSLNRPPFSGGALMESLSGLGLAPSDVTDVVFTHLHFDHVGWASVGEDPAFPNATYRCDDRDWAWFMDRDSEDRGERRSARLLGPVRERIEVFSGDGPLLPGIDRLGAAGHTPGSAVIVLSDGDQRAMLLGDVVHCPVELLDDEWAGMGDVDPDLAKRTRIALAREIEQQQVPVAAAHFPGLHFGRVLAGTGTRRWVV